jgi:hypothetical protein
MAGPSVGTAKANPINRAQRDRCADIGIDLPGHSILEPNPLAWVPSSFQQITRRHACLVHANDTFRRQICASILQKQKMTSCTRLLAFDVAILRTDSSSVEARGLDKKREWIEREVIREAVSEQAKPTILCDISELLTLLWTLVFEPEHILKMMNHLMNEHG